MSGCRYSPHFSRRASSRKGNEYWYPVQCTMQSTMQSTSCPLKSKNLALPSFVNSVTQLILWMFCLVCFGVSFGQVLAETYTCLAAPAISLAISSPAPRIRNLWLRLPQRSESGPEVYQDVLCWLLHGLLQNDKWRM